MNKNDALKAVDDAFVDGVKHLYDVFVQGLIGEQDPAELAARFERGLSFHREAHAKTRASVDKWFGSQPA